MLLTGEAGIGKSRLVAALEERIGPDGAIRMRCFCSPHHTNTALHPVITDLQRQAGFEPGDDDRSRLGKLQAALADTVASPDDIALLADMLSIPMPVWPAILEASPKLRKERSFAALRERLQRLAASAPLLVVFEDAHWADASSLNCSRR